MGYITKFDGRTDQTVTLGKEGQPNSIEGYFLGTKDTPDTGHGPGKLHIFQTAKGYTGVWGKTRLNNLLTNELVGQMVRATFTGMIQPSKKGRSPSYGFKVEHDPGNKISTAGVNVNATGVEDAADEGDGGGDGYGSTAEYSSYEDEGDLADEIVPPRPTAPKAPASTDADRKARMQALLNRTKK